VDAFSRVTYAGSSRGTNWVWRVMGPGVGRGVGMGIAVGRGVGVAVGAVTDVAFGTAVA